MKRYTKRFLAFLLSFLLILTMVPFVGAAERTFTGSEKLYVNLSAVDWWQNDDAVHALYFFGSNGNAWALMEQVEGNIYGAAVPAGTWTHVIVVRLKSGTTTPNWNDKWDQTGDIPLDAEKNYITSFAKDSASATWDVYDDGGQDPTPGVDYYLFGWINGADYGDHDDYATIGDYKFVNGKLTATFTEDSYVGVKTGDNAKWYMTDGDVGNANPVTLYNTNDIGEDANKMYVPGNVTVNFTLTVDAEADTLTLAYTTGGDTPIDPPTPGEGRTFDGTEKLYINGLAVSWWDDYSPLHRLTLTDADGVETIVNLSWVANVSETERVFGGTVPAGTYCTVKLSRCDPATGNAWNSTGTLTIPAEGNYIKAFAENDTDATWTTYTPGETPGPGPWTPGDHSDANDMIILHCWNWSYDTIREHLSEIKAAGYTAVQTSPAQPVKGYGPGVTGVGDWWMIYQPLGFVISPASQTWMGSKDDLQALCSEAHALGIDVIVDVVSNHVGNGWNTLYEQCIANGMSDAEARAYTEQQLPGGGKLFEITPPKELGTYNPELYPADNPTRYFRDYVACTDNTTVGTVHGNIGMPDLMTEEQVVQDAVLNYLEELIDVGVDGFRFDAAKHIETPSDGQYASNFWPYVIGGANEYAQSKGKTLWNYGEILYQAAYTRKMSFYTPYIDVTDINYAGGLIYGFGENRGASAISSLEFRDWNYKEGEKEPIPANAVVIFAETHDMFSDAHYSTAKFNVEDVNKSWAVAAARADASSLYFARPAGYEIGINASDPSAGYPVGNIGQCETFDWMDAEVAEVNKFHTAFVGAEEYVHSDGDFVVIERWNEEVCGVVLVNAIDTTANVNVTCSYITDGTYYDQVTGNTFTVSGGVVSGQMGPSGIVVLRGEAPVTCEHPEDQRYTKVVEPTCTESGTEAVYCHECGRMVELIRTIPALGHIDENNDKHCDRCGEFLGVITVYFVDSNDWIPANNYYDNIRVHAWSDSGASTVWPGIDMKIVGRSKDDHGIWKIEMNPEKYTMLQFNAGAEGENQTINLSYVEDAGSASYVIYTPDYIPASSGRSFDGTESLYVNTASEEWWRNDGAILHITLTKDDGTQEDLVLNQIEDAVYGAVIPAGYYTTLNLSRYNPNYNPELPEADDNKEVWNRTGEIGIPAKGNYISRFQDDSQSAIWSFWPSVPSEKVNTTPGGVLTEICGHTAYEIVTENGIEKWICDCCGTTFKTVYTDDFLFVDVSNPQKYYFTPVYWALRHEPVQITAGTDATHFSPNKTCTRAQVVTFLWNAMGRPEPDQSDNPFVDVKESKYFYKPVLWAYQNGVTKGADETHFDPNGKCTRAQVVSFLWNTMGKPEPTVTDNPFVDVKESKYYYKAVLWAVEMEITKGTDESHFSPNQTCTRGQVVTFLYKLETKQS